MCQQKGSQQTDCAAAGGSMVEAAQRADDNDHRKQNHCEIEKRRRDKMNQYIMELASVIPSVSQNQGKFDKLTVLRMAVQHVKSLRSSLCSFSSFHLRPSFLSSGNLLKNLILQMASQEAQDNLFMVVSCDRGKVLFVSQSSKDILNQEQDELVGQCLFDIVHKDDVPKVKEQISYFELMPKEMLVDSKTLQPIKHQQHAQRQSFSQLQNQANSTPQPGARRSFFCRMRIGRNGGASFAPNSLKLEEAASSEASAASAAAKLSSGSSSEESPSSASISPPSSAAALESASGGPMAADPTPAASSSEIAAKQQPPATNHDRSQEVAAAASGTGATNSSASSSKNKSTSVKGSDSSNNDDDDRDGEYKARKTNINNKLSSSSLSVKKSIGTEGSGKSKLSKNHRGGSSASAGSGSSSSGSSSISSSSSSSSGSGKRSSSGSEARTGDETSSKASSSSGIASGSQASAGSPLTEQAARLNKLRAERDLTRRVASSSGNNSSNNNMKHPRQSSGYASNNNGKANSGSSSFKKQWRYSVMHCTGYLKSITLRSDEIDDDDDYDEYNSENNNSSDEEENDHGMRTINCLVAVCRRSPMDRDLKPDRPLTFTCRYSMEGKFVFVDQRTTVALGYTPQQLLGTSHYAYCQKDSVNTFKECHRQSILKSEPVSSDIYQFKRANGQHLWLQTSLKSFRNPWTKFIDYIVASHTTAEGNDRHYNEGCVPTKFNQDMTGGVNEGSQSSSPASSSSLSLPSTLDSKKSSSPSSSSIGSSYSMESYASGGSIQALLNQIDRIKSGGIKHASLDFVAKSNEQSSGSNNRQLATPASVIRSASGRSASSATGSQRKQQQQSGEENGNFSDPQSCSSSSISSQNENPSIPSESFININQVSGANYFGADAMTSSSNNSSGNGSSFSNQQTATLASYCGQKVLNTSTFKSSASAQNFCSPPDQSLVPVGGLCRPITGGASGIVADLVPARIQSAEVEQASGHLNTTTSNQQARINKMSSKTNHHLRTGSGKIVRPSGNSQLNKQQQEQRIYGNHQFHYRSHHQNKSSGGSSISSASDTGNESATWSSSSAASSGIYPSSSKYHQANRQQQQQVNQVQNSPSISTAGGHVKTSQVCGNTLQQRQIITDKMSSYVLQPVEPHATQQTMSLVAASAAGGPQIQMHDQIQIQTGGGQQEEMNQESYVMPTANYDISGHRYANEVPVVGHMDHHQMQRLQMDATNSQQQQPPVITSGMSQVQHHHQRQQQTGGQGDQSNHHSNVPMNWNTTDQNPYQQQQQQQETICISGGDVTLMNMDVGNSAENNHQSMTQQPMVQCQQCANHKCSVQQQSYNNTDLNSINLTSLMVDGDLDEDQLLEYLADCEPETQLYHIQNNAYPQYNIYK